MASGTALPLPPPFVCLQACCLLPPPPSFHPLPRCCCCCRCRPRAAPTRLCLWASTASASRPTWPRCAGGAGGRGAGAGAGMACRTAPRLCNPGCFLPCGTNCTHPHLRPIPTPAPPHLYPTPCPQVAYWLLQNGIKVMIAACDTFRSGAVEQLKTHCARLQVGRGADGLVGAHTVRQGRLAGRPLAAILLPGYLAAWLPAPSPVFVPRHATHTLPPAHELPPPGAAVRARLREGSR